MLNVGENAAGSLAAGLTPAAAQRSGAANRRVPHGALSLTLSTSQNALSETSLPASLTL